MKVGRTVAWTARLSLAAIFIFFGSNLIVGFMASPRPAGIAGEYRSAMVASGYIKAVGALQILGGLSLLADATAAFGLVVLGPIIVNIAFYHVFFRVAGLPLVAFCVGSETVLIWLYRANFKGLFRKALNSE